MMARYFLFQSKHIGGWPCDLKEKINSQMK
jgi:hypothetical protein